MRHNYERRIISTLPLRKGACVNSVLQDIYVAVERFWHSYEVGESRYDVDWIEEENAIWLTPRRYNSKGRPRKAAMRTYVTTLITVYESATGNRIKRNWDAYAEQEKPHPFLAICIKAGGWGSIKEDDITYPKLIVRQVLERLKKTIF